MALAVGVPPASPGVPDDLIEAGRVGRPHGLDGSFYVTRAMAALLTLGADVRLAGRATEIVRRAGTDARPIVRVEGITDRDQAEAVRGQALLVPRDAAPVLGVDEYWAHELEGCAVVGAHGPLGVVAALMVLPSCEALQVSRADGGELLVPLVRDAIEEIDLPGRRIRVNLGFLGLED